MHVAPHKRLDKGTWHDIDAYIGPVCAEYI